MMLGAAITTALALLLLAIHCARERRYWTKRLRELDRLQRLNAWQHWPAPQSPAELEQQALALRACSPARAQAR